MAKTLPPHLKKMLKNAMKTDKGRRNLADLVGATFYRSKSGKMIKRRRRKK